VSLISWRGLDNIASAQQRLQAETDDIEILVRVLGQLSLDLQAHQPDDPMPSQSEASGPLLPLANSLRVVRGDGGDTLLELIRTGPQESGTWQRVAWHHVNGTLRRAAGAPAGHYPLPSP